MSVRKPERENLTICPKKMYFFTGPLTRAIIHILHLHHLCVDSPSEQVAWTLCGRLAVF